MKNKYEEFLNIQFIFGCVAQGAGIAVIVANMEPIALFSSCALIICGKIVADVRIKKKTFDDRLSVMRFHVELNAKRRPEDNRVVAVARRILFARRVDLPEEWKD